jgi:undecaprenyl diphosphate synthase
MSLLEEYIAREVDELRTRGVRVRVLGDLERLTPAAAAAVQRVIDETAHNDRLTLNLFISYGGRAELVRAVRLLAREAPTGRSSRRDRRGRRPAAPLHGRLPRSGPADPHVGEQRISNFLLWQLAYTELFISQVLWPDFGRCELYEAVLDFQNRERRFGRVSV